VPVGQTKCVPASRWPAHGLAIYVRSDDEYSRKPKITISASACVVPKKNSSPLRSAGKKGSDTRIREK